LSLKKKRKFAYLRKKIYRCIRVCACHSSAIFYQVSLSLKNYHFRVIIAVKKKIFTPQEAQAKNPEENISERFHG